jgi:hypothetical protein
MLGRTIVAGLVVLVVFVAAASLTPTEARAAGRGQPTDWNRFYYYPYIYYPHNFERLESYDSLYYRYPPNRRIPVYNKDWYNYYPSEKPYYRGHHHILDVF